ncbi:acyl-CoA dehydrogenase family protein [Brevibacterium litoralis]|uniref:acyl-CoA dehydrogenase family protein n=1 Tax=Brevibacterium litoralis TaxID=3138935 RepID=UPI0032F085C2
MTTTHATTGDGGGTTPDRHAAATEVRDRIRALLDEWRADGRLVPVVDCWLRSIDKGFSAALGEAGLLGLTWPQEFGGQGRPNTDRLALTEELLRAAAPVAAHWIAERQIGPAVLRAGTPELKAAVLPDIVAGLSVIGLGMSEPESGSDLASVRTRAVPVAAGEHAGDTAGEGGWNLNGHKIWTTQAHNADRLYVLARTTELEPGGKKHQGLSEFLIDMDSDGVEVSPIVDLAGEHHFNEVRFTDVFVPRSRLIGEEGQGWKQVVEQLSFERGGPERALSTWPLLPASLDEPGLRTDEGALRDLGQVVASLAALRHAFRRIAQALDAGQAPVRLAAASKYLGNVFEKDLIDVTRRLVPRPSDHLAGLIEKALWASPAFGIRGGAEDVLLGIVAKAEMPRDLARVVPLPPLEDPEAQELVDLAGQVAGGALLDVDHSEAGQERLRAQTVELGWTGVSVPESAGGSGGSLADALTLVRGLARKGVTGGLPEALRAAHVARDLAEPGRNALCALLDSAVLLGASESALALTIEHVTTREQFGQPLARIPAVQTWIARMRVQTDLAGLALERAVEACGPAITSGIVTEREVSAAHVAKVVTAQAGGLVAAQSHQLHGAIGITAEYPLHRLTQLIWATRDTGISEHQGLVELGRAALGGGEEYVWDTLTAGL